MPHDNRRHGVTPIRSGPGRRLVIVMVSTAMLALALVAPSGSRSPAYADTAPPDSSLPTTVSTDPLPTAQIDGVVWTQLVVGDTVYVGGNFANARPAGAAAGTQLVPRANLLAYNIKTGVLDPTFNPSPNGEVRALAASPDGSTLYVGGQFTKMGSVTKNRIAAFSTATGGLVTKFTASTNSTVVGLAATESAVYLSGNFSTTDGAARIGVSAVKPADGTILPWAPVRSTSGSVKQIIVSPDRSKVILGGNFTTMNGSGNPGYGLAAVDATAGTVNLPLPVNSRVRNAQSNASILSLVATADGFYGSGYVFNRSQGNLEGAFKADWDGNLVWLEDCHGDSYSVFPSSGAVYVAGHPHYCGNVGGFPQTDPDWTFQRGIAFSQSTSSKLISKDPYGYANWEGTAQPTLLNWFPDINTGTYTGQSQGPWSISGNSTYVVYGGEFTAVNGKAQQGLVRFAQPNTPNEPTLNTDGPRLSGANFVPTVRSFTQGGGQGLRISWKANYDRDNEELTYKLLRNGTQIGSTITKRSSFWQRPVLSFIDTAVDAGTSYSYQVKASDPFGNEVTGSAVSGTPAGGVNFSTYDKAVLNDNPQAYWPLGDNSGETTVADFAGSDNGTRGTGVTQGVAGAIPGDGTAYRFNGASNGSVGSSTSNVGLDTFSVEAWFKTTTTSGGKIVGFGRSATGSSTGYDRQIYLNNAGRIYFGVNRGVIKTINSTTSYNNGQWHHAVGTVSPQGMSLYVDGQLIGSRVDAMNAGVYPGFWRIGGDAIVNWPGNPPSPYFAGDIDQVAVYPEALSAAKVQAHYALRLGGPTNVAPVASFTSSNTDLTASVDGSGSSDTDGTVSSYAWDFGDGATGAGATTSHLYAAAGTYPVKLTVTDNDGGTGTTTHDVTVTAPAADTPFVVDTFGRTVASGLGTADTGGAWTVSGGPATDFSVAGGKGRFSLPAGSATRTGVLASTVRTSSDVTLTFSSDAQSSGGTTFLSVLGRRVSSTVDYRTDIKLPTSNSVIVNLSAAQASGTIPAISSLVTIPGSYTPGAQIKVRMQVFGTSPTTVRAKVWFASGSEPAAWTVSATDSFAGLQQPGSVGFRTNLSSGATNLPRVISLQDLTARPVVE